MSFLRTTVTGSIFLPDGSVMPDGANIIFTLRSWDKDADMDAVALPGVVVATVENGAISVDLIRTASTDLQTTYDVGYIYRNKWTQLPVPGRLGVIAISGSGPVDLADILALPAPVPDVPDALAQALAAAGDAMAAAQDSNNAALMALVGTGTGFDSVQEMVGGTIGYGPNSITHNGETVTVNVQAGDRWVSKDGFAYDVLAAGASSPDRTNDAPTPVKLAAVPLPAEYIDRQFDVSADGETDDAAAFQLMASKIPAGKRLHIAGAGTRMVGSAVTFAQEGIEVVADKGAMLKQGAGTQSLDTLLTFSGDRTRFRGFKVHGNLAGNTGGYTGRGELVRITGDDAEVVDFEAEETQDVNSACALFLYGNRPRVRGYTSRRTGRVSIRLGTFDARLEQINILDVYNTNGNVGSKGIAYDITPGNTGAATTQITIRDYKFYSEDSGWLQPFVFDHDGVYGGRISIEGFDFYMPNSEAPDFGKPVFLEELLLRNGRMNHKRVDGYACSLRVQEAVGRVILDNVTLPGAINFDRSTAAWTPSTYFYKGQWRRNGGRFYICIIEGMSASSGGPTGVGLSIQDGDARWMHIDPMLLLTGGTHLCAVHEPMGAAVEQFAGQLIVHDGCSFSNLTGAAINTDNTYGPIRASIGRCNFHGAAGYTPYVLQDGALHGSGSLRGAVVGDVSIAEPLSVSGTFRDPEALGAWRCGSDRIDAGVLPAGGVRELRVSSPDMPPRRLERLRRGDVILNRAPSAGDDPAEMRCVSSGASCQDAWQPDTAYAVGAWVYNGTGVYACNQTGTSASSGGPSGTGTSIADNGAQWAYVAARAVSKGVGTIAA